MMVLLKNSAHGHGSGHPSEPPNSTYMLPNGRWCCRAGVMLGICHCIEKTCEQEGEEDPHDAKTPNRADPVDAFGCSNSRALYLHPASRARTLKDDATNRVSTPRWSSGCGSKRAKMSIATTYHHSCPVRRVSAVGDAIVRTIRITLPPAKPARCRPAVMPRFLRDRMGLDRAYAPYMRNQHPFPSWTSHTLH
jgi:hypothetical protein